MDVHRILESERTSFALTGRSLIEGAKLRNGFIDPVYKTRGTAR